MSGKDGFEPKIIGFLCNWCSYAGADLAGVSRIQYPPNIRIIRVMCSGRIDPAFVFEAFRRINLLKRVLKEFGLEPERLRLEWISASEGDKFAAVVRSMVEEIKKLGPNPLKNKEVEA
jgi:F420-non-reducing hydrogenase iron-sulfur subunit